MALTPKQQRFVEEYIVDLNATQAAIRAGYSERRASEIGYQLLQKTTVQEAISAAQQARSERTELTQDWVIEKLRREAEGRGQDTSSSARVAALKLLGLHRGMFPKKLQVTGKDDGPVDFRTMSDEELRDYISNLDRQIATAPGEGGAGERGDAPPA